MTLKWAIRTINARNPKKQKNSFKEVKRIDPKVKEQKFWFEAFEVTCFTDHLTVADLQKLFAEDLKKVVCQHLEPIYKASPAKRIAEMLDLYAKGKGKDDDPWMTQPLE